VRPSSDPPSADRVSHVAATLLASAIPKVKALGVTVTDLIGDQATIQHLRDVLDEETEDRTALAFAGHGSENAWLRREAEILLVAEDLQPYRGLRVYAHACHTAGGLGRLSVQIGIAEYYLGYRSELVVYYDRFTLQSPRGFAQTAAAGVLGVLTSGSADTASAQVKSEYQRWIRHWQRRSPPIATLLRLNLGVFEAIS
jgi:hypothetical protein